MTQRNGVPDGLKRLANAFSGKREPVETPPVSHTPLKQMLAKAAALPQESWVQYAFGRENLRDRIPKEQWGALFQEAADCGKELARAMVQQHSTRLPQKLADKLGLLVKSSDKEMDGFAPTFAQFVLPNAITIYTRYSKKAQECYDEEGENAIDMVQVENTLLAHEIFHYLEEQQKDQIYTQTKKVQIWKKPFPRYAKLDTLGEIAGMAFAQEYLGLSYIPYVLDILLMYSLNIDAANVLYQSIISNLEGTKKHDL